MNLRWKILLVLQLCGGLFALQAQVPPVRSLELSLREGVRVEAFVDQGGRHFAVPPRPALFSFEVNDSSLTASEATATWQGDSLTFRFRRGVIGSLRIGRPSSRGCEGTLTLQNATSETLQISNIVPLGRGPDRVYITAAGPHTGINRLSRSELFRPNVGPIGVVLPDDAWELGYCDIEFAPSRFLTAIARRTGSRGADIRRFRSFVHPGGAVEYVFHVDQHEGTWQDGLRMMFQQRWLYDLQTFDNTLFERKDLAWVRHAYLAVIQMAWDQRYYDAEEHRSTFGTFLHEHDRVFGGYDIYVIWPTWPRLGLDQRNQFDMYRDLPGGLPGLKKQAAEAHQSGTRYFISYNPWDESTRREDHLKGLEELLRQTDADGVVLDTWGESSKLFQALADSVKPGIIMYSEGMAVPKDMPGIVAGRVHDALFMPPPLNLNKLIKPDFAIFRVMQLKDGRLHREAAVAFFNGYGTELNIMGPGRPSWVEGELRYLGRTTKILRENSSAFLSTDWTPLVTTATDSIWVNKWPTPSKTIYTAYSLRPEGWSGPLFDDVVPEHHHLVNLWHHEEIEATRRSNATSIPVTVEGFSRSWLGTRREGNVDCVALMPDLLQVDLNSDLLTYSSAAGTRFTVWAGNPSYDTPHVDFPVAGRTISLREHFGKYQGKIVVQLFDADELLDERVTELPLATPVLVSSVKRTPEASAAPAGMVEIPEGVFLFKTIRSFLSPNEFIPYPDYSTARPKRMRRFFMDRYPVTNAEFKEFLDQTHSVPKDTANFLKHWVRGNPPPGEEDHPVVYVGLEDARAYAKWAGKRLPTELEWQYAAQGLDGRSWPWGDRFDSTKCNVGLDRTTPVAAFPKGASPFGVEDLVGNVWQLTNDVYDDGSYYFGIIKGGSYYHPTSSVWYIQGGPQPADNPQILLMVSPGFDRSATVGFRCVKDARQ